VNAPIAPQVANPASEEIALYEIRRKIYPRAVEGAFARWRWGIVFLTQAIFYGLPWLEWNGRQAVLFDLGARKFYIFGLVFWPQDVIYLAVLLIVSALSLFCCSSCRRCRCSCSPRSQDACGAATPVHRPSIPRSSSGSSARSRAIASLGSVWTQRR
jgi:hypothetical protein